MKRFIAALLTGILLLSLCACGEASPDPAGETETVSLEPLQEADPMAQYAVPESEEVPGAWFSDAAFIGDSVSVMLQNYNATYGRLGNASFLCSVSLSQENALTAQEGSKILPEFPLGSGWHPKLDVGVAVSQAKKLYIMLGINCLAGGVDNACRNLVTLLDQILAASPQTVVLVESVTPMTRTSPRADAALNNEVIRAYNYQMLQICRERGWYFVNVAEAVSDEEGYLRDEFSGDTAMGIHFNYQGAESWTNYLLTHVPEALK